MSVGQELLDVPLPEMVAKLGAGIADAQHQLDMNSVEVAKTLAETEIEVVPAITRTISADGSVDYSAADAIDVSLLQAGLFPTFYQFSEATIEVEMDIKTTTETETSVDVSTGGSVGFGLWSARIDVDVSHNRKFGKEVDHEVFMVRLLADIGAPDRLLLHHRSGFAVVRLPFGRIKRLRSDPLVETAGGIQFDAERFAAVTGSGP
ncbi:MAG: hypothetical protein RI568_13930 [Natronomonas sp.]|uniref:hypothetical protein n=1 Tax=Natronomonas sp. TaxID=2184060 RepID=UPI00286FD63C|nr:hypothetical protein [Natronomonas sp.]MDR9431782.1 hypothetical protein [Natronomonas sp.]